MRKFPPRFPALLLLIAGTSGLAQTASPALAAQTPSQSVSAQTPRPPVPAPAPSPPASGAPAKSLQQRMTHLINPGNGAWSAAEIATMNRIREAAMTDDYALTELRHLTDNIGPRLSGSAQAAQAVDYVAGEMRALGATVTLEKTMVPHWVRGVEQASLIDWKGMAPDSTQKIVLTALGGSVATPAGGITAPVVVVRSFDEFRQLPPGSVKGKIVLFNHPFDQQLAAQGLGLNAYVQSVVYRGAGPTVAAAAGAVAVLVRSVGGADFRLPHTGATSYDPSLPKIPAAAVTAEDADLMADLTAQGPVKMHLTLTPQTLPKVASYNVIADWTGTADPEQVVIVSGHLDSWDLGTGAIDDGAGVAVSMQVIHLMQELKIHPRRTIRFIAWMDEESGSEGAATYAAEHAGGIAQHVGALESDLGCDHPTGITFAGAPALEGWLAPVAHQLEPIGAAVLTPGADTGEDIESVVSQGVPGFAPTQDNRFYFNYHHTAADTFDKVNPRNLDENAAVMAVLAYALADSADPAPRAAPMR
jgi:Zn-dependent M28 family amino/carboxypeptidase